jgi:hypothetical protein
MPGHRVVTRDFSRAGLLKTLGGALMGLHLGHKPVLERSI